MAKKLIEVFVERNCASCMEVMGIVGGFSNHPSVEVRIFDRSKDQAAFQERNVLVCPATFIDHQLIFYGAFTVSEFVRYLT